MSGRAAAGFAWLVYCFGLLLLSKNQNRPGEKGQNKGRKGVLRACQTRQAVRGVLMRPGPHFGTPPATPPAPGTRPPTGQTSALTHLGCGSGESDVTESAELIGRC